MKEIGGYLELERFSGGEYYPDAVALNNGRCALRYILCARGIRKLLLPAFLCASVRGACEREGVQTEAYHIGPDFLPRLSREPQEGEWLYVVNYFGQLTDGQILELHGRYPRLIMDNVQAFFHRPLPGIDTVYSCRKFFGVPDGGYAVTDAKHSETLPKDRSMERMTHLLGRLEGPTASEYYGAFKENDRSFAEMDPRAMSELTHVLLRGIRYEDVKRRREANFKVLDAALGRINPLHPRLPEGPYSYPFYCGRGMELKRELAKRGIFVPTLWPNVLEQDNKLECDFAMNILPLPCDQRYDADDMNRIAIEILNTI